MKASAGQERVAASRGEDGPSEPPVGDVAAFSELVRRYQDVAFASAYARLGDRQLAEDAVQEAFLTAFRQLDQLRNEAAFPAWLRSIVHRQCQADLAALRIKLARAEQERDEARWGSERDAAVLHDRTVALIEARGLLGEVVGEASGHGHWDHTMQHGAGCPLCIRQREFYDRVCAFLAPTPPSPRPLAGQTARHLEDLDSD